MLKNKAYEGPDLTDIKWELEESLPNDLTQFWTDDEEVWSFSYPVTNYPTQVKSLTLDQTPLIKGTLTGIRGQYLYIDEAFAINIRRHTGYQIKWEN